MTDHHLSSTKYSERGKFSSPRNVHKAHAELEYRFEGWGGTEQCQITEPRLLEKDTRSNGTLKAASAGPGHNAVPDTFNQKQKERALSFQCCRSMKTCVVEGPQGLNHVHLRQSDYEHAPLKSCRWPPLQTQRCLGYFHALTSFFSTLGCSVDPQRTWDHLLQLLFVFAESGWPEFCLVTLSLGRNRQYFRALANNVMVVYHNCKRITTVFHSSGETIWCPSG